MEIRRTEILALLLSEWQSRSMVMLRKLLKAIFSIDWDDPGSGTYLFWLIHIVLGLLVVMVAVVVMIRSWLGS